MNRRDIKKEFYKGNKLNFAFLLFASFIEAGSMIVISILLEKLMAIASSNNIDELYKQGVIFIILLAILLVIYLFLLHIKPNYKMKALNQYKNNIYNNLLKKNIENFNKEETSVYISALTNDVNYIEENYIFNIFELITQIVLFVLTLVVMFIYSSTLTIVSIIAAILPLIVVLLVGGKLAVHEKNISDQNSSFMHFIKDNLIGFSTIKVFKSENKLYELFKKNNNQLEKTKAAKTKTTVLIEFLQAGTSLIAQFVVFFIGAYLCIKTDKLEPSVIILFVQLMNTVISPLITVPSLISKRRACNPLFDKIINILEEEKNDIKQEKTEIKFDNQLEIKNLEFTIDNKNIINNTNFKFEKDKSYAIVGASGSGKSTLVNLLSAKYLSYNGEILYDNKDLKETSIDSLFEIISLVEQNVFVFDDTIQNNITMYSTVDQDLLNETIKKSGLSNLINEKGSDYKCGENGCKLSGGEKQRISIARALLKKSKIIFMDEGTSALDNETSNIITNNVLDLDNVTKIIITHKLEENILKRFDEIIVMKNGSIYESGNFEDLINKNGLFKSLYELS